MPGILGLNVGKRNVVEICTWAWYYLPEFVIDCYEKISSPSVTVSSPVNFGIEAWVGILFIICAGILGIVIVELLYNKLDWYLTPLVDYCIKRYAFVQERNRLSTMQGHP